MTPNLENLYVVWLMKGSSWTPEATPKGASRPRRTPGSPHAARRRAQSPRRRTLPQRGRSPRNDHPPRPRHRHRPSIGRRRPCGAVRTALHRGPTLGGSTRRNPQPASSGYLMMVPPQGHSPHPSDASTPFRADTPSEQSSPERQNDLQISPGLHPVPPGVPRGTTGHTPPARRQRQRDSLAGQMRTPDRTSVVGPSSLPHLDDSAR